MGSQVRQIVVPVEIWAENTASVDWVCGKLRFFSGRPADAASAACLECPRMHELSHSTWGARTIGALEAFTQDQVAPSLQ